MQGVKQPGRRQKQAEDDESRRAPLQRQQRRERDRDLERVRDRVKRERDAFGGCYAPVLEAMLQPLPKQASALPPEIRTTLFTPICQLTQDACSQTPDRTVVKLLLPWLWHALLV